MNEDTTDTKTLRRISKVGDWLALVCLAAMVSVPLLHPRHYNPIPSFWSEWWAFAFGIAAAALLLIRPGVWRPFGLPAVAAIPLAFLTTALVQYFIGRWYFVEPWLMYATYLLWATLLMLAGRSFVARRGFVALADVLAVAILFGALCNTAIAALQFHNVGYQSGWVFLRISSVPYSNLGQPNHFNHELWIGIASLFYLHLRGRCRLSLVWPTLLLLLMAATMSTSKSILLYSLTFTALAGVMRWKQPTSVDARTLWHLTLPLLPLVLLLQFIVSYSGIAGDASLPIATQRLFNQVAGYEIRWRLARTAWDFFLAAPLLGNGIGTLPWQFFVDNSHYPLGAGPAVAEHAHNLLLQLLAEYGVVPVAIMLGILSLWARKLWQQQWQIEHWWLVAVLSVAAIHSMLEYPLWYSFFLGPTALLLGAADKPALMLHNGRRGAALCGMIIAVGIMPLTKLRIDYQQLESSFNTTVAESAGATWKKQVETLTRIQRDSLLEPHVMAALASMMEIDNKEIDAKVEVCKQGMKFAPSRRIVFKCGALMAIAGDEKGALVQIELASHAYPKETAQVAADLKKLAPFYRRLLPLIPVVERYADQAKQLP